MVSPPVHYEIQSRTRTRGVLYAAFAAAFFVAGETLVAWVVTLMAAGAVQPRSLWVLAEDWTASVNGHQVTIPEGFVFDLASIPRFLWWVPGLAPFELAVNGPLVHDWLYRSGGRPAPGTTDPAPVTPFSRAQVDGWFRDLMATAGVPRIRRTLAWLAVRTFGWAAWRG